VYNSIGAAFIAGSAQDNDVSQRGCTNLPGGPFRDDEYVNTAAFGKPANFYINVTEM
jgi:hypothetical protein